MGKAVKTIAIAIVVTAAVVVTFGAAAVALGLAAPGAFTFLTLSGVAAMAAAGAAIGALTGISSVLLAPDAPDLGASIGRLNVSVDPQSLGKWIFGETACATDMVYAEEYTTGGQNQSFEIFAAAAHLIDSFGTLHLNDELITFTGSDPELAGGRWTAILEKHTRLGTSTQAAIIPTGSAHPSTAQGRGLAQFGLNFDLHDSKLQETLGGGIPTRITQVVKGAPVYDPRLDSTRGGSGAHRADDQTTWEYANGGTDIGENWALIVVFYLLGWETNGKLSFGVGVDPDDIDWDQAIAAANVCEETVDGASRYKIGGIISLSNDHGRIIGQLEAAIGGKVSKVGGKYYIWAPNDDLVSAGTIVDEDLVRNVGVEFSASGPLGLLKNTARGDFVSPADLYQLKPYPEVEETTAVTDDGRLRLMDRSFPFTQVESIAERVAREMIRRTRFSGTWMFATGPKGLLFQPFDVITINLEETDDTNQLVRILDMTYGQGGIVAMEVIEEDASIYDTSTALGTSITQLDPSTFDPTTTIAVTGLAAVAASISGTAGTLIDSFDVTWDDPGSLVATTEVQYKPSAEAEWQFVPDARSDFLKATVSPLEAGTVYDVRARHVTIVGVVGVFSATITPTAGTTAVVRNTNAVGSQLASTVQDATINFNTRNDRIASAVTNPTVAGDGTAVDHVVNTDGSVDISFEWSWGGSEEDIDGFYVFIRSSSSGASYNFGTTAAEEHIFQVRPDKREFFLYGVPGDLNYTFGVQALRIVDTDIDASRFLLSTLVQPALAAEDPFLPTASIAFTGDISGTVGAVDWQTQVDGPSKPEDDADVTNVNTSNNTDNVGSQSATAVQDSVINFSGRNDRDATAVVVPTILADGTAIDHVVRTDGSVDISFEWVWTGTEADIDGFAIRLRGSTSSSSYVMGTTVAEEQLWLVQPDKRVFFIYGAPADIHYTFAVRGFRIVDPDIDASGFIITTLVQPSLAAEDPFQPEANVAFAGDLTGTVSGTAAATIETGSLAANAGLTAGGVITQDIPIAVADSSNVLRHAGGDIFVGELDADLTSGATSNDTSNVNAVAAATVSGGAVRANAGLAASGDVDRPVPSAEITQASVTQHEGAITAGDTTLVSGVASATIETGALAANAGLTGAGVITQAVPIAIANDSDLLRFSNGGLFSGDLTSTDGADWDTGEVQNRPVELTDDRVPDGIDSTVRHTARDLLGLWNPVDSEWHVRVFRNGPTQFFHNGVLVSATKSIADGGLSVDDTLGVKRTVGFRERAWIAKSANFTLTKNESGKMINVSLAATMTIPNDTLIPQGSVFYIRNGIVAGGTVTITAASGVFVASKGTLVSAGTQRIVAKYGVATLVKEGFDDWTIYGDVGYFESSQQTFSSNASVTHSLGIRPTDFELVIRCTTAAAGYAVGDEVRITALRMNNDAAKTVYATATVIGWAFGHGTVNSIVQKTGATTTTFLGSSWRIVVRGWARA